MYLASFWKSQEKKHFFFNFFTILTDVFIFGHPGFSLPLRGFSLVVASRGYSRAEMHRPLTAVASLAVEHGLQDALVSVLVAHGLCSGGTWALDHKAQGSWHMGSSQVRDQTCVSCIGRWPIHHGATREVLK